MRVITGEAHSIRTHAPKVTAIGALEMGIQSMRLPATTGDVDIVADLTIDTSRVTPTGPVTVPPHIWQPVCLYLGNPV